MFENVDRRTTDTGVTGILIAHLRAFGSSELKMCQTPYTFNIQIVNVTDSLTLISAEKTDLLVLAYALCPLFFSNVYFFPGLEQN